MPDTSASPVTSQPGAQRRRILDCCADDEDPQPITHAISLSPVSVASTLALRALADRDREVAALRATQDGQRHRFAHSVATKQSHECLRLLHLADRQMRR